MPKLNIIETAARKGRCPNAVLLTTAFVCFCPAAELENVLHVSICAAFLKNGFSFFLYVLTRNLKPIPVFEFRNTCVTALFLHLVSPPFRVRVF